MSIARTRRKLRNLVAKTEYYPSIARLMGQPFVGDLQQADLVLEAPPRSGNSFAEAILRLAFPDIRMVHHTHAAGVVVWASKHKMSSIVLIRDPDENAISTLLERPDIYDWSLAFREWSDFYLSCESLKPRITVCPFTTLVSDPMSLVRQTETLLGRSSKISVIDEEVSTRAMEIVDQLAMDRVNIRHTNYSPFVSDDEQARRRERKEKLTNELAVLCIPERRRAREIFVRWTGAAA